ncbi:MAG: helix-hairpin-helix domain-containing protein, partial [Woeseia sp.]
MNKNRTRFLACLSVLLFPMLALAGPVNVNTANAEAISAELQGVGLSKAQAIVAYRNAHGPFKSVDDLALVKGIGARTVEINRKNIVV